MPSTLTYPGIYVEEIPSGVRTIVGVATSDTAFVDFFSRGPMNQAVRITSFADFERVFGGLDTRSEASYGIQQYYLNGGSVAWVVRVAGGTPAPTRLVLQGGSPPQDTLTVEAASPGLWGDNLEVGISYPASAPDLFNLVVREVGTVGGRRQVVNSEIHRNLSMNQSSSRFAPSVVNSESSLLRLTDSGLGERPTPTAADVTDPNLVSNVQSTNTAYISLGTGTPGNDGSAPDSNALIGSEAQKTGMYALDRINPFIFNILCLPAAANLNQGGRSAVYAAAKTYCENKRAFLIVDIPEDVNTIQDITGWIGVNEGSPHRNAAVYYPRLIIPDALNENRQRNVAVSGTLAGVYARTDASRGVWKAPAGTDAPLRGANLVDKLTDPENGGLNPLGINVLRNFPIFGNISWGARTLEGADQAASEWKYIPVRRTALFIEESLFQGLKWVVFEPNDEPLWAQIRLNVGAFMQNLFRQGAFQGTTPRDAYFVRCDKTTTTQDDINRGIVNILVGFAPLKPAEFVVIKIQQMAGQIEV
jgi:phage tail sheath protein FI